jgi:hypothetical protein
MSRKSTATVGSVPVDDPKLDTFDGCAGPVYTPTAVRLGEVGAVVGGGNVGRLGTPGAPDAPCRNTDVPQSSWSSE